MPKKGFIRKTCAYFGDEGISAVREHVIARKFLLKKNRNELPVVPACNNCNTKKSKLENYALAVLPLGSRRDDAREYAEENVERRLARFPKLNHQLVIDMAKVWEWRGDLLLPTVSIPLQYDPLSELLGMIIRGMFMSEFGFALHKHWDVSIRLLRPDKEHLIVQPITKLIGPNPVLAKRNIGVGTLDFECMRSLRVKNLSFWKFTILGGLRMGDSQFPNATFTRFSALTTRPPNAGPLLKKEGVGVSFGKR